MKVTSLPQVVCSHITTDVRSSSQVCLICATDSPSPYAFDIIWLILSADIGNS